MSRPESPRTTALGPAVFAGVLAALLIASRSDQQNQGRPAIPPSVGAAILIWIMLGPLWLLTLIELIRLVKDGSWNGAALALPMFAGQTVVLFPWPITRFWLIPRGRVRAAWFVTRLSFWAWRGEVAGGAVIAAAWALNRREPTPELITFVERRRDAKRSDPTTRWQLGGAGIVATALIAAARGDRVGARQLLASVAELSSSTWPKRAIVLASEWLCAEAMERGAWREVEFVARTSPVDSATLRLLAAVASRMTGIAPIAGDTLLQWRWLWAPHRRALWPLVALAMTKASKPSEDRRSPSEPLPLDERELPDDPLVRALFLHALLLTRPIAELDVDLLERSAKAWGAALADPLLRRHVDERRLVLGCRGQDALAGMRGTVEQELGIVIATARLTVASLGENELLERIVRRMQSELLDALEVSARALEARVASKRELPAIDEWQAFLTLREQHAATVAMGGLELRRLAFSELHGPLCSLAVWLWNDRGERALGNAMFQWLLAEAIIVDNAEAIRLQERNVACGV